MVDGATVPEDVGPVVFDNDSVHRRRSDIYYLKQHETLNRIVMIIVNNWNILPPFLISLESAASFTSPLDTNVDRETSMIITMLISKGLSSH